MVSSDDDLQYSFQSAEQESASASDDVVSLSESSVMRRVYLGQIQSVLRIQQRYQQYAQVIHLSLNVIDDDDGDDGDFSVNLTMRKKELLGHLLPGHRSQFKHGSSGPSLASSDDERDSSGYSTGHLKPEILGCSLNLFKNVRTHVCAHYFYLGL